MHRRQFVTLARNTAVLAAAPAVLRHAFAQEGGLAGKTISIGCSGALTGPLAGFGQDVKVGAEAAMAQINARGGIHGRQLQLNMVDDGYVAQRTADNVRAMLSQGGAFALLSCVGTPNNAAILPLVEESGLPYVAPLTGAASVRKSVRNVFHVRAGYADEVQRLVQRLAEMGLKSVGIVAMDNPYGRELAEDATRALAARGLKPALMVTVATDGSNVAAAVAKAAETRPAALILATAGTASVAFVGQLRKAAPGVLLAGVSATFTSEGIKQLGEAGSGIALTMVMPDPQRARNQLVRDYQAALRARGVQDFTLGSLEAYVNLRVLAEGLERAGSDPTRSKLRNALAGIRNLDLGGFVVDYAGNAPYVGSRYIDLSVLGTSGRFLG